MEETYNFFSSKSNEIHCRELICDKLGYKNDEDFGCPLDSVDVHDLMEILVKSYAYLNGVESLNVHTTWETIMVESYLSPHINRFLKERGLPFTLTKYETSSLVLYNCTWN